MLKNRISKYLIVNPENRTFTRGPLGGAERRCQVLAAGADGVAEPRGEGHLHGLSGWAERVSGSDRGGVSAHRGAVMHCASGAGLAELRALESAQTRGNVLLH